VSASPACHPTQSIVLPADNKPQVRCMLCTCPTCLPHA
jgi:hypothetical protein